MNDMKNSERVRQMYVMSGLTYAQLSELTDIKQNTLACWITGRRNPPDYVVEFIRDKLKEHEEKR